MKYKDLKFGCVFFGTLDKISYLLEKTLVFPINCSTYKNEDEKIFKEEESIEILNVLGLIENI